MDSIQHKIPNLTQIIYFTEKTNCQHHKQHISIPHNQNINHSSLSLVYWGKSRRGQLHIDCSFISRHTGCTNSMRPDNRYRQTPVYTQQPCYLLYENLLKQHTTTTVTECAAFSEYKHSKEMEVEEISFQ